MPMSVPGESRAAVAECFTAAVLGGDHTTLVRVLAPGVALWTDGDDGEPATVEPIYGRDRVALRLKVFAASVPSETIGVRHSWVSADTCLLVVSDAVPLAVMVVDIDPAGNRISCVCLTYSL